MTSAYQSARYGPAQELLGRGTFGVVYRHGEHAIKWFQENNSITREAAAMIETALMTRLSHPHIVGLIETVVDQSSSIYRCGIVMELASWGTLEDQIVTLSVAERITILYQVGSALSYLHKHNILHRDIKPSNVLLYRTGLAKLSDLGSVAIPNKLNDQRKQYSLPYRPPELFIGCEYGKKADLWAYGALVYYSFTGFDLLESVTEQAALLELIYRFGAPPLAIKDNYVTLLQKRSTEDNNVMEVITALQFAQTEPPRYHHPINDPRIDSLLRKLLIYDSVQRPTMEEVLSDSLFVNEMPISTVPLSVIPRPIPINKLSSQTIEWLLDTAREMKLRVRTIQAAVRIMDSFMMEMDIAPHEELGWTREALYIAALLSEADTRLATLPMNAINSHGSNRHYLLEKIDYNIFFYLADDYRMRQLQKGDESAHEYLLLALSLTNIRFELNNSQIFELHLKIKRNSLQMIQREWLRLRLNYDQLGSILERIDRMSLSVLIGQPVPSELLQRILN